MWGIPPFKPRKPLAWRFIPTHVGNTPADAAHDGAGAVHPHACGEYTIGTHSANAMTGFIPTHVGNTFASNLSCMVWTVHPHACGEYSRAALRQSAHSGSSPRMWGIRDDADDLRRTRRFIPTHVGNTGPRAHQKSLLTVHPHACGEYFLANRAMVLVVGSSPRMWGILFRKMQEITDCWQSSSVLPSHACCKPAPMTIKRGRSFVKRLLPLVKHCPAGQSRSLDVTCPDRRNARLRS